MQPEVIANLWTFNGAFMSGQLIYQVGIRLYVATGSDDEKTAMLRTLAAWDYHLAHVFPPSCGATVLTGIPGVGSMEVKGVMPANAPGMELMDRFQDAFDAIKKSLPEHPSAGGIRRAPLDLTNLLNVHTPVDVDKDGNMSARTSDPQLARNKPTAAANLWAFADAKPACVHGLAGRAYLLAGRRTDLDGILRDLAANDWLLARRLPVPRSFSATIGGQAVPGRADVSAVSSQQDLLFAPVLEQIEQEIPIKHTDWAKKNTHRYVLPRDVLIRRASVVREDAVVLASPPAPPKTPVSPPPPSIVMMKCSCGQKLSAPVSAAGKKAHCPTCNKELVVPTPPKPEDARPAGAALKSSFSMEERSNWTLQRYAQAIANKVTNRRPCEESGLEAHSEYIRTLGLEVNDKFGFEGMQQAWQAIYRAMGPGPCSDLTRIWDGVGRWQK